MLSSPQAKFWNDKKVFITGHTGFKGSWLAYWLHGMNAKIAGYSLAPPNNRPSLFQELKLSDLLEYSHIADIRNFSNLKKSIHDFSPDVLIHLAAQPLVRYSYKNPLETYEVNVLGTAHVLEAIRTVPTLKSTVIVTSDKCYENIGIKLGYSEDASMGGLDPYSSSKGCVELLTNSYRHSFFSSSDSQNFIATARAGNVIGGGDWSEDRLIPDAIRAFEEHEPLVLRNPTATRPWQHVLEPLSGYLALAQKLYLEGSSFATGWNFGPQDEDNRAVGEVIDIFISKWGKNARWMQDSVTHPHEARLLHLNSNKAKTYLDWMPKWHLEIALEKVVSWHKAYGSDANMQEITMEQIKEYQST